jgi:hypothetical protein
MAAPLGFKTFNTGDVLSAADTNGYLMQGVLVFADAAARSAAITSPQEGQTSYLKDTDVIQVYSGSAWVTKSGGSSPLTTKGDLYTYSTTDARLPVGTNGHTLVADSAEATGLKWQAPASSGGMTVLASGSMPTGGTVLDLTSISGSYNHLQLVMRNLRFNGAYGMDIRVNNKTTGIYQRTMITSAGAVFNNETGNADTGVLTQGFTMTNGAEPATIIVDVLDYTNTTAYKIINTTNYSETHDNTGVFQRTQNFSGVRTTEAIDRITTVNGASQVTDGTYTLYGIK